MKVTIVHTNNKKQLLVSTKTMEKLLQRIAKDDSRLTVTHFREYVTYMESGYEYYKDMPTWMHIYPAAEFTNTITDFPSAPSSAAKVEGSMATERFTPSTPSASVMFPIFSA